jgi:hypothetical protein
VNVFIPANLSLMTGYHTVTPTLKAKKQRTSKVISSFKKSGGSGKRSDVQMMKRLEASLTYSFCRYTNLTITDIAATKATSTSIKVKGTAPPPTASNAEHQVYLERWCKKFIDGGKANLTNVHFTRPRLATQEEKEKARKSLDEAWWVWKCK